MKISELILTCLILSFTYALASGAEQVAIIIAVISIIIAGINELFNDDDVNNS